MSFSAPSRMFLTAALAHLTGAGIVLFLGSGVGALTTRWDLLVWLLLIGFVGFTTAGFALHLFPTVSRRPPPPRRVGQAAFVLAEGGLLVGAAGLVGGTPPLLPGWLFSLGALLFLGAEGALVGFFARELVRPRLTTPGPERRPGDSVTLPLFVASWMSAVGSGVLFVLSGLAEGPGFGWWIAAVHLFALGHAVLLITAVSLRLVPRSLNADVSRPMVNTVAGLGIAGAFLVPVGMLTLSPSAASELLLFASPEAAFAVLFISVLIVLVSRAGSPRPEATLHLTSVTMFLVGGALGLWMVSRSAYAPVDTHAMVNVLGFVGLTILFMWFGMIAPFQRVSHVWTRRMLGALAILWVVAVVVAAAGSAQRWPGTEWLNPVAGALLVGIAIAWGVGTLPVLYPDLNPLPGVTGAEVRALRERWKNR